MKVNNEQSETFDFNGLDHECKLQVLNKIDGLVNPRVSRSWRELVDHVRIWENHSLGNSHDVARKRARKILRFGKNILKLNLPCIGPLAEVYANFKPQIVSAIQTPEALIAAAKTGDVELFTWVYNHVAPEKAENVKFALLHAAQGGHIDIVKLCLKAAIPGRFIRQAQVHAARHTEVKRLLQAHPNRQDA